MDLWVNHMIHEMEANTGGNYSNKIPLTDPFKL